MKVQELGIEEMARLGATHRVSINFEDLNGAGTGFGALSAALAAATSGTLKPFATLAAGSQAQFAFGYLKTPFDGGATSELTAALGYDLASGTDKAAGYLAATSLHQDATFISYFPQEIADVDDSAADATYGAPELAVVNATTIALNKLIKTTRKVFSVANDIGVVFTATGANFTTLTIGEVHLYFRVIDLTKAA